MNNKLPDYYKILGVDRLADDKEIERAFRQKAMQCHPDRFSDPKEKIQKTKEFQTINEAYTLLSKYSERKSTTLTWNAKKRKNRTAGKESARKRKRASAERGGIKPKIKGLFLDLTIMAFGLKQLSIDIDMSRLLLGR